jgi:hypothetical protein
VLLLYVREMPTEEQRAVTVEEKEIHIEKRRAATVKEKEISIEERRAATIEELCTREQKTVIIRG